MLVQSAQKGIVAAWSALSPNKQAAISAIPDIKGMNDVLVQKYYNDPDTGRDAFGEILSVGLGALAGAIALSLGAPMVGALAVGYGAGKVGEWLGEQVWDALTSPEAADSWASALGNEFADEFLNLVLPDGMRPIDRGTSTYFSAAKNWTLPRDPIILDLDGNGLETVGLAANVYFDHNGDDVLTRTGWVGPNDALLVWDRNANGTIDTGAELFGDFTPLPNGTLAPNGFAALAALDENGDGIIDASDPAFADLKLWKDADQNGQTGAGELIALADAGIVSLSLANTVKNQSLSNGNKLTREGHFTRADGSTAAMGEFQFATEDRKSVV